MSFDVKMDLTEVRQKMKQIQEGAKDMTQPLEVIGDDLIDFFANKNIDSQGAELHAPWRPHSVHTLMARARRYGHYAKTPKETTKIMVWTGALREGFRKAVERTKLTIDNTVEYFKYNLDRPMLGINAKVKQILMDRLEEFVKSLIK